MDQSAIHLKLTQHCKATMFQHKIKKKEGRKKLVSQNL